MMRLNRCVRAATLLSVTVMGSGACAPRAERAVVPGLAVQLNAPTHPDTIVYQRSISRGSQDSSSGTRTVVMSVIAPSGGPTLLEVVQRFPGRGGEIVDTALADVHTLRAVAHQSHQPTRTMRFSFTGTNAEGTVALRATTGDSVVAVHQDLGGPIFDSNVIELVVAALPLRAGFSADVPFFIYERGGRVVMRVTVRERATVAFSHLGRRDVWVVGVAVPGAPATMWIDTEAHVPLRVRYDLTGSTTSFTDERITPLS